MRETYCGFFIGAFNHSGHDRLESVSSHAGIPGELTRRRLHAFQDMARVVEYETVFQDVLVVKEMWARMMMPHSGEAVHPDLVAWVEHVNAGADRKASTDLTTGALNHG